MRLLVVEHLLERATLEPLEDHVRHLATVAHAQHADVARLTDRRRALGELGEERALLDEHLDELIASLGGEIAERAEHLDGDRSLPDLVGGAIDDRKSTFADDPLDLVFLRDRRTDEG